MKYYLIIGYQLFEKYREFPTIRVYLNDAMLDEFLCDNEESIELEFYQENFWEVKGRGGYKFREVRLCKNIFSSPKKFSILELDSSNWGTNGKLKIEVFNNDSDYTNGFISKRNLVNLSPVFLIPKDLLHDSKTMRRLMQYDDYASTILRDRRGHDRLERWRWPGQTGYQIDLTDDLKTWQDGVTEKTCRGGSFELEFDIRLKYNTFILTPDHINIIGTPRVDYFFRAWYQRFCKEKLLFRNSKRFDRDLSILSYGDCAPSVLESFETEIESKNELIIRNYKNK